jgi:ornithine carbamoyltransferase
MPARHLLSIRDLSDDALRAMIERSVWYSNGTPLCHRPLKDRIVGCYFRKTSTRTRTAFSSAALRLGAQVIPYGPADLQENTGETSEDTGSVLSSMLDAFVVRTAGDDNEIRSFAAQTRMAVINAMSAREHPTQAVADLATVHRRFGRVDGLRLLYMGEGNNTAAALALALSRFEGTQLHLRTPPGYGLDAAVLEEAREHAAKHGGAVQELHNVEDLPTDVDVVYTTRWQTTGTSKPTPDWRTVFKPFQVDLSVMRNAPEAVFMHDLPAHREEEVTGDVLDGPRSIAFMQAEFKLFSAMAVLEWCMTGKLDRTS